MTAKRGSSSPRRVPSRREISRWQVERKKQHVAFIILAIAVVLILAIPAYGYYQISVAPSREPAIRVNDKVYNWGYFMKFYRNAVQTTDGSLDLSYETFAGLIVDLQNYELARQAAPKYDISVSAQEVDDELRRFILGERDPKEETDPAQLERQFKESYKALLGILKLSDKDYRDVIKAQLFLIKIRDKLGEEVPAEGSQVHLYDILTRTKEKADEIAGKLKAGEDFQNLAMLESLDEASRAKGGELGWFPRDILPDGLEEVAFSLEAGAVSEPISTSGGYYILKVTEKADNRPIDESNRGILKSIALFNWLQEQRETNKVEQYDIGSERYQWAIKQVSSG